MMPVSENLHLADRFIGADEVLQRLGALSELLPDAGPRGNGPARYFRFPGAPGSVGVITPLSHNYCDSCNRVRLTADGRLRTCLFGSHEVDLKTPLRAGGKVGAAVERALQQKPERHMLVKGSDSGSGGLGALSQIGG
jgi:cyclic pyranopterin phosphate synthase